MATRYFNWKLAIVLVVAAFVFIVAAATLHRWQKSTRAEHALVRGQEAYAQRDWDRAADQLGRYLMVNGKDTAALISYANASRQRRVDGAVTVLRQTPAAGTSAIDNTRLHMAGVLMGGGSIFAALGGVLVWRKLATAKSTFEQTAMLGAILDEQRWQPPTK